ncbi:MAG: DUF533 domain-containing protein [Gammaproteobacteria bacterium]|jgi:uncharacterized protein (DUF697 family)/tellurite resistance protein|nr:DUF533 domain-containing protein [Gammaproteobacteria bacterium]
MSDTRERDSALLTIALFAAFADGSKHADEREEIRNIAESLAGEGDGPDLRALYQDVLLKRVDLAESARRLADPGEKHLAYEMAVGVCDADGRMTGDERAFLDNLRGLLGMDAGESEEIEQEAEQVVEMTEAAAPATVSQAAATQPPAGSATAVDEAAMDKTILNYSILNGALELLPQSWASMAIIPLQIRMVYGIGKEYGVELDRGHIKEFLATLGVGMTSQYLEQFGRKLIGGLFRSAGGRTVGRVGRAATGMAFSFATTYALGNVARRYYAGGRQMSTELLKSTFNEMLGSAKEKQSEFLPQIEQKAQNLDMGQVMSLVKGGGRV